MFYKCGNKIFHDPIVTLNDEWGIYNFQSDHDIVDGQALNDGVDQYYIYRNFRGLRDKGRSGRGSSYLVKIGFSYRF